MDCGSLLFGGLFGALLGAVPSWLLGWYFASKSSQELDSKIQSQTNQLNSRATLQNFRRLLKASSWHKEHIGDKEMWICDEDNTFQFLGSGDGRQFHEQWTEVFPDRYATMFQIHLRVLGVTIKSLEFISADGGRYTLPLPELVIRGASPEFYWRYDSTSCLVADIIANFYRYTSLEQVARFTKVNLVEDIPDA